MIIDSGLRAGFVIGLRVTPSKIQHDGSRWNRKFGSGGRSIAVGSLDCHTKPDVALDVGPGDAADEEVGDEGGLGLGDPLAAPLGGADADLALVEDVGADPLPGLG